MYVKPQVRKGLLGRMLTELLETRVMVKQAMKGVENGKVYCSRCATLESLLRAMLPQVLRKILDARQLGLKFISNVTYGYTGASYSGRMPAVEIADSIVQSGRETLEKVQNILFKDHCVLTFVMQAIRVIDSTAKWNAKVVYGDTDSVFVYLRGKTKEQAFRIGYEMADIITAMNPAPIKLKFEKVLGGALPVLKYYLTSF